MRYLTVVFLVAVLLSACSEPVQVRRTDGEEAVALAIVEALQVSDFAALEPVMVSPDDIARQRKRLSKAEMADSTTRSIIEASWQLAAEDLPRDIARAREAFATVHRQGIEADIDWETIEYTGYNGQLVVMREKPARLTDFEVHFQAGEASWTFFVPRLQRFGTQWKITGFLFRLYDETGAPAIDPDSWEGAPQDEDSWEVTEETTSE